MVTRHKRLAAYRPNDFDLLLRFAERFERMLLSPNVLTETSNLAVSSGMNEDATRRMRGGLAAMIAEADETYIPSATAVRRPEYAWLGLTDSALLTLCSQGHTLLTSDTRLQAEALKAGFDAINFERLRDDR